MRRGETREPSWCAPNDKSWNSLNCCLSACPGLMRIQCNCHPTGSFFKRWHGGKGLLSYPLLIGAINFNVSIAQRQTKKNPPCGITHIIITLEIKPNWHRWGDSPLRFYYTGKHWDSWSIWNTFADMESRPVGTCPGTHISEQGLSSCWKHSSLGRLACCLDNVSFCHAANNNNCQHL